MTHATLGTRMDDSRARADRETLAATLLGDARCRQVLLAVRDLDLPDGAVGAGAIRDTVWDALSGHTNGAPYRDVDVVYFDASVLSPDIELHVERQLTERWPVWRWDVKNQAAVHLWYRDRFGLDLRPRVSLEDAVSIWPETATAVAVRLEPDDRLSIVAPLGLRDLLNLTWRHNPAVVPPGHYRERLARKQPQRRWPGLRIID